MCKESSNNVSVSGSAVTESPDEMSVSDNGAVNEASSSAPTVNLKQLLRSFLDYVGALDDIALKSEFERNFSSWIGQVLQAESAVSDKYRVLFLYADRTLSRSDADRIYQALSNSEKTKANSDKPALLILHSPGGYASSAYMIGKMLHEYSPGGVEIVVPRKAKSAATLLCCAANHIHMGSLSELGPIDPQLEAGPALGLKASIEHLARLTAEYPKSTSLFVGYMAKCIDPVSLGYCERAAESAMQYAERLLESAHNSLDDSTVENIARKLTYDYKDHGFVIDKQEASGLFPPGTIICDSKEYGLADAIYQDIRVLERIARINDCSFSFVGSKFDHPNVSRL